MESPLIKCQNRIRIIKQFLKVWEENKFNGCDDLENIDLMILKKSLKQQERLLKKLQNGKEKRKKGDKESL